MRHDGREFLRPAYPRRRRKRSFRVVARWLRILILSAPVVAMAVWLLDGSTFRLRRIDAPSSPRVPASWIRQVLRPELGGNLFRLSLAQMRERLSSHPWLARVEVRKELPDGLRVLVEERRVAAVLETPERDLWFVDREGRRIAPVGTGERTQGLLMLAAGRIGEEVSPALRLRETECLRRAIAVAEALAEAGAPGWGGRVTRIEIVGDDDFRLLAHEMPFTVLVRSGDVVDRARLLVRLLPDIQDHVGAVGEVDLRFAGRVVVRPVKQSKET